MSELKIIEVNSGIANNFGTHIEVNKNLKNYPELYKSILKHEHDHTDKLFSFEDLKLDLLCASDIKTMDLLKFAIKHPRALTQFMPVWFSKRDGFYYDINMIILYSVFFFPIIGAIILGIKFG